MAPPPPMITPSLKSLSTITSSSPRHQRKTPSRILFMTTIHVSDLTIDYDFPRLRHSLKIVCPRSLVHFIAPRLFFHPLLKCQRRDRQDVSNTIKHFKILRR